MKFTDLLSLDIACAAVASPTDCLLAIGDAAEVLVGQLVTSTALTNHRGLLRVLFGLPILTAPHPVLVGSLMTEHNTQFNQLSLFGWIEDNAILEPRAEVIGLTPCGDSPVLFLRDLDLDRPPEAYVSVEPADQPKGWLRVRGVAIARRDYEDSPISLAEPDAALSALELALPARAQPFVAQLRAEVVSGIPLRQALRTHRRKTDPAVMAVCDGWRVLSRAARFVLVNPMQAGAFEQVMIFARLHAPRRKAAQAPDRV